jgi:hypothetical protein
MCDEEIGAPSDCLANALRQYINSKINLRNLLGKISEYYPDSIPFLRALRGISPMED